jgi:hypothetical protein
MNKKKRVDQASRGKQMSTGYTTGAAFATASVSSSGCVRHKGHMDKCISTHARRIICNTVPLRKPKQARCHKPSLYYHTALPSFPPHPLHMLSVQPTRTHHRLCVFVLPPSPRRTSWRTNRAPRSTAPAPAAVIRAQQPQVAYQYHTVRRQARPLPLLAATTLPTPHV